VASERGRLAGPACYPPPFLDAEFMNGYQGNGIWRLASCGREVSYEWRKGNIRTRVPPSSIDRRAPRSMSSRCARVRWQRCSRQRQRADPECGAG
jgi:hypothetical protein